MKVFAILNVARQINGDMVFVRVEKAYNSFNSAQDYLSKQPEKNNELVQNSKGFSVECSCIRSLYEIEVEE